MTFFLNLFVAGILVGGIYAILALGFVLVYKSTHIFNFAQGQLLMVGAFVGWAFCGMWGLPMWLTFLLTMGIAAGLGFFLERFCLRPMIGQSILASIMMTIGLSYALVGGVIALFPEHAKEVYPSWLPMAPLKLGILYMPRQQVILFIIALVLLGVFVYFFRRTKVGLAMRATAEKHQVAQSVGINVKNVFAYSWAIAAVSAALAGIFLGSINGITFNIHEYGLKVFPVVIIGGLESIGGVIVGGILIGLLEYLAMGYLDPILGAGFGTILPFIILVLILVVRPYGLFGLARIERV